MPDAPVSRRSFLDKLLFTALATAGVTALSPIPFFLRPPPAARPRRVVLGSSKKFVPGIFELFDYGGRRAIALHDGESLRVLDRHCTHQGCDVAWVAAKSHFECPCHGAIFGQDGSPIQGPNNGPLSSIPHRITGEGDLEVGE